VVFLLNKKWFALPVVAFMMIGLVGCADNDNDDKFGVDNNRNNRNNTQNVRYNPNDNRNNNGNGRMNDANHLNDDTNYYGDNDGRRNINNPRSKTYPYDTDTKANDFWTNAKTMDTKSERLAQKVAKIAAKQKNVNSAQSYVAGDMVFVTLEVKEGVNDGKVIESVRSALRRQVKGKNFNIASDVGSFDEMRNSMRGVTSDNAPANRVLE
jgi:hypothetical protein